MENCAYINGELINLYTAENPILEANDICYGLIFSVDNFHRPIIIKGVVVQDKFVDGMNKHYYIRITDIYESPKNLQKFFIGKQFTLYPWLHESLGNKRNILITKDFNINNYVIKLEGYYVRNSESKIIELRNEYINIVRKDLEQMLSDIDNIDKTILWK